VTADANAHRDKLRRGRRECQELHEDALEALAQMSPWVRIALGEPEIARGWKDDLLRLLFACCHPALDVGESAALALATVIGLSTNEIAAAFVVAPRSMEQRLTRARRRLRERGDYEGALPEDAHDRVDAVLRAIHLLFNEGYWSTDDDAPIRAKLCRLAVGLARSLLEAFPNAPEVAGLLSVLLLHDARRGARLNDKGEPVPLPEQDRARWDSDAIVSATALLERALAAAKPGPFQIEAAISAVHCRARTPEETDWREFGSKKKLFEALLTRYRAKVTAAKLAPLKSPDAAFGEIKRFFRQFRDTETTPRDRLGCLMCLTAAEVSPHEPSIARIVSSYLDELRALFRRACVKARARGDVRSATDVDQVADYLAGAVLGLMTLARAPAPRSAVIHYVDGVLGFLMALRSKGEGR